MLITPRKQYVGYRNYELHYYIKFEKDNFTFNKMLELLKLLDKSTHGGRISRLRLETSKYGEPEYIEVENIEEIAQILNKYWGMENIAFGFIKENSIRNDNEVKDFSFFFPEEDLACLNIQSFCKDHLQEFYDFFSNLQFFKDNNIDFLKMSMINPKLDDFVETYFRKLYNETGRLEYRDVANGDFTVCSGINWTCIKAPHVKNYRGFYITKTFGKLPLCPFGNFDFLDELPVFKLTRFNNGAIWLQLTEDVCPWDDDPAYIQALHTFVDAYIEKRDEYFYSLPIEVQNEMLGNLKPNS